MSIKFKVILQRAKNVTVVLFRENRTRKFYKGEFSHIHHRIFLKWLRTAKRTACFMKLQNGLRSMGTRDNEGLT